MECALTVWLRAVLHADRLWMFVVFALMKLHQLLMVNVFAQVTHLSKKMGHVLIVKKLKYIMIVFVLYALVLLKAVKNVTRLHNVLSVLIKVLR